MKDKRLKDYAKEMGVCYKTAWNWFHEGKIDGYKSPSGSMHVRSKPTSTKKEEYIVVYSRVSSSENKSNLDSQAERLVQYANARGYQVKEVTFLSILEFHRLHTPFLFQLEIVSGYQ